MADFKFEIGEGQIQNAVAIALAESFSAEKRDALLRDIIRAHLSVKANDYTKETLLSKTVGNLVREIATEEVKNIINESREKICELVRESLGQGFQENVFEQLKNGLAHKLIHNISIGVTLDDN